MSGAYNYLDGKVKGPDRSTVGDVSGYWHSAMEYSDRSTGKKSIIFDASTARSAEKSVLPEAQQEENESRR